MSDGATHNLTKSQRKYERHLRSRIRIANAAAWLRAGGIQVVWLVILIAGAAVPLTEALTTDGWTWVSPVLGFVIVIAAGIERIFGRTTDAAVTLDALRRNLARERRLLMANADVYATSEDPFSLYAKRAEEYIARYDEKMIEYSTDVLRSSP